MRKIIVLALLALFVAGVASADPTKTSQENSVIFGSGSGAIGVTAPVETQKCYLHSQASASVGDVVVWNLTAQDGYCVDLCTFDLWSAAAAGHEATFAGVMVTATSRVSSASASSPKSSGPNVGYMAVRGFCVAKCDTSECMTGQPLRLNGASLAYSFGTAPGKASGITRISQDIGVLLYDSGADGLMRVYLH